MKKHMVGLLAAILAPMMVAYASPAQAGAGVSIQLPGFGLSVGPGGVGLNVGLPWVVAPAPVPPPVHAYPVNTYEPVVLDDVPEFVLPPELGFYVAVGVPYDMYFYNNSYWVNRGSIWYSSAYYNGPWSQVYYSNVPYVFNRYPFERIRHYRDTYYGRYRQHGTWQGYNHFRPERRVEYRGSSGRDRHDYARPSYQSQPTRTRNDFRSPNNSWQGNGSGYTASRPITRDRDYRDSRVDTRTFRTGQQNTARPAYYRTTDAVQRSDNRPAQISPPRFAPTANTSPAYNRPNRNGQLPGSEYTSNRRYTTGQGGNLNRHNDTRDRRGDANRGWQGERM